MHLGRKTFVILPPLLAALAVGCGKARRDATDSGFGAAGSAGAPGSAGTGGAGPGGSGSGGTGPVAECTPGPTPARLVRLRLAEVATAIGSVLNPELAETLRAEFDVDPDRYEGTVITDADFRARDGMAQAAAQYVRDHFSAVTGCGESPTEQCARDFVAALAERAFRRPVRASELDSLLGVLTEVRAFGASVEEAVQYGVYAVFESPWFLYRTEFGSGDLSQPEVSLSPYELASALSFFVTGGPPDESLLEAASAATSGAQPLSITEHVDRLLARPEARQHLEASVLDHFGVKHLQTVVLDPAIFPTFTSELRNSMSVEASAFVRDLLWSAPITELILSRRTRVNAGLAELYGIAFPPAPATIDEQGYAEVELPPERAGLITQVGFLTARSRPDGPSVVSRGLWINAVLACRQMPPFPEGGPLTADDLDFTGKSEREKAELRMDHELCGPCHREFDPYGLALESFDGIGRFRTTDPEGRPIEPAVVLPESIGGQLVSGAVEMAEFFARERFSTCLTRTMLEHAVSDALFDADSCEVQAIVQAYQGAGDPSFSALVREIAVSKAFKVRVNQDAL